MNAERIPILMYHRVGEASNDWERKYCVSPKRFSDHMHTLARAGWRAVPLDPFFAWLDGRHRAAENAPFCLHSTMAFSASTNMPRRCLPRCVGRPRHFW